MTYHLGVDLGTTYTAAAIARDRRAQAVTLDSRSIAIPSVVYFGGDSLIVGHGAQRRALTEPARVAREFKRRVGDPTPILLGGSPVAAELLMARLLDWVVGQVAASEGAPPASLAVTHPANWGEYKLDLLRQAIRHVGLSVDHLVAEPVAAATFYASERDLPPGTVVAVYDLGGGTFDAAVVRVDQPTPGPGQPDGFRIVGRPEGIERLGGIDFDHAVFHHVTESIGLDVDALDLADPRTTAALAQLRSSCVEGKEALSNDTDVSIPVMLPDIHTAVRLTRAEFEAMVRPGLDETLVALRRAVASADVAVEDLHAVLLVGGSSRIPLIALMVMAQLGRPAAVDARPKEAISLGAALAAAAADAASTTVVRTAPPATVVPPPTAPGRTAVAMPPPSVAGPPTRGRPAQWAGPSPQPPPSEPSPPPGGRASRAVLVGLIAGIVVAAAVAAFLLTR
ncbi:MAG: Hsp70 family protein, partial [Acidimicrobiales bacterium]